MRIKLVLVLSIILSQIGFAQDYELKSTASIYHDLQELHQGLRVLYLAAHPDDENTRLISWLENDQHIRTAYLSLTRGQGGQNLIGDEKGDGLGVIRTYELLEARKLDGGEQFFTRAVDFGYSKSATESFEKWGKEEVLSDVVYVIRKYRPHVIITRFPPTRSAGHGHHEASAILAAEAFDLAADAKAFPEQLLELQTWQTQTLYHNTSGWWDKSLDSATTEQLLKRNMFKVNIGVFNDITGLGVNEIASLARSKHRCQAFGTPRDRGENFEYLELVKGELNPAFPENVIGIWSKSPSHKQALAEVISSFNFTDRAFNLNQLQQKMDRLFMQRNLWADPADMDYIMNAYNEIIRQLAGLRVEAFVEENPIVAGDSINLTIEFYNAGKEAMNVTYLLNSKSSSLEIQPGVKELLKVKIALIASLSNPYWLRKEHGDLYVLENPKYLGLAMVDEHQFKYSFSSKSVSRKAMSTPIHRKWNDRSYGEFVQPIQVVAKAHINSNTKALIVPAGQEKSLSITVKANSDLKDFSWQIDPTRGWEVIAPEGTVNLAKGQQRIFDFKFIASKEAARCNVGISLTNGTETLDQESIEIKYDHIPNQIIQKKSTVSLIPIVTEEIEGKILYIEGSGDEVDDALELIGYSVDKTPLSQLSADQLIEYKTVITGIRAFNTNQEASSYHDLLMDYVKNGGNLIVQYNTTYDLSIDQIGPYPFKISRNRVTEEDSEVTILDQKHPVFNAPNKIKNEDWQNWIQERGLYFASDWSNEYKPLIAWHDKDEDDQKGGLIVAQYGEGSFFYTGISFFRELPAGVPGAYRLLVNIIEYNP